MGPRLPGQQRAQGLPVAVVGVQVHEDHRPGAALGGREERGWQAGGHPGHQQASRRRELAALESGVTGGLNLLFNTFGISQMSCDKHTNFIMKNKCYFSTFPISP